MARSRGQADALQEELLDRAAEALEEGDLDEVLKLADRVLQKNPEAWEALHFRAAAFVDQGKLDDAERAFDAALAVEPDDPSLLLGAADLQIALRGEEREHLEKGLELAARGKKLARKRDLKELTYELSLLEGMGFNQLGESRSAVESLGVALELDPDAPDARVERGIAHFELSKLDDARQDFEAALQEDPDTAWAHHYLGLIAERRGDAKEAERRFARATELAPDDFPHPVKLTEEEFDRAVEDAIVRLPEHAKQYLGNTTIAVEQLPADEDLIAEDPPLSPSILGVFRGVPVGERSVTNAADHATASIVLYQKNLERFARTRDELIEQIGITVMHEVGHLMGLDEEDLWERGLD